MSIKIILILLITVAFNLKKKKTRVVRMENWSK